MAYLTEKERYQIEILLKEKYTPKQIAERLHRHKSTIYREIKRGTVEMIDTNLKPYTKYCADTAQNKYDENKLNNHIKDRNRSGTCEFHRGKNHKRKIQPAGRTFSHTVQQPAI